MISKNKKVYPVRNSPPQRPFGRASAGVISSRVYLIGLAVILAGLFFLASVSSAWAAGCQEKAKGFSFFSAFNPLLSFAEKTIKSFGYNVALATAPDPDTCGSDNAFCAENGTAGVTIVWDPVPYSAGSSGCEYYVYMNFDYYILTVNGVGSYNTGSYNGSTVSSGLANNTTYYWSVEGYCICSGYYYQLSALAESCYLTSIVLPSGSFTTPNCAPPPPAPSGLSATPASCSQINLSWQDNSNNEDGFKIERKTGAGGTYAQIDAVGPNITTYSNYGLSENTTYYYWVRAYSIAGGDSPYSNEANATTPPCPPILAIDIVGSGSVNLNPPNITCTSDCSQAYDPPGQVVTLSATPSGISSFKGWSGDSDCNDGVVAMDTDKTCIANFKAEPWWKEVIPW